MIVQARSVNLPKVSQAIERADADALLTAAHAYKSVLGLLGENAAFVAARRLEMMAREGVLEESAAALEELQTAVAQYERVLRSF
jgi:HPt (histidine-containing phosphotransfer) domain-containing protein